MVPPSGAGCGIDGADGSWSGVVLHQDSGFHESGRNVVADSGQTAEPGTAEADPQSLEKNHDLYADFDSLDDLEVQQDVKANP